MSVTAEPIWQDPPPKKQARRREDTDELVDQLKSRPGAWALVDWTATAGGGIKRKYVVRGCEVAVRKADGEGYDVYARWVE